jgi:hypothetical protein
MAFDCLLVHDEGSRSCFVCVALKLPFLDVPRGSLYAES